MSKEIKCPYCGSKNITHTALGYGERFVTAVGAGATALIPGAIGAVCKNFYVSQAIINGAMNYIPSEYKCKRCKKTFHANKAD